MDAADVVTPLGSWASIRGYFTPATLFLMLNLVIGTIALTSRSHHQRRRREHHHDDAHHHHHYQASPPPLDPQQQDEYHHYFNQQQQQHQEFVDQYVTPPPAPIARTSSVLDRLRSISLYRFRSGDFPPEYGGVGAAGQNSHDAAFPPVEEETAAKQYATRSRSEPAPAPAQEAERRAPAPRPRTKKSDDDGVRKAQAPAAMFVEAAVAGRAEEGFVASFRQREPEPTSPPQYHHRYQEEEGEQEYVPPPAPMRAPPPLSRTSSVLDRLRSLGLYSFLGAEQPAPPTDPVFPVPAVADNNINNNKKQQTPAAHAHYDRSRSEPAREQGKKKERTKQAAAEPKMAKSSSATRKPNSLVPQQSINTRADAFIDSFRREQSQKQHHHHDHYDDEHEHDEHAVAPPPAPLARTSSVLDRLRSFSLYLRSGDPVPEDDNPTSYHDAPSEKYGRSRSEPAREHGTKKSSKQGAAAEKRMSKTSSEADMQPTEECVDARADDFINKFRQQLQLQRLNSLLNYKQ